MEDKAAVARAFGEVLKMTRDYHDLVSLEYLQAADGEEIVTATFENGTKKIACVNHDSEVAMIADIMKQIVRM